LTELKRTRTLEGAKNKDFSMPAKLIFKHVLVALTLFFLATFFAPAVLAADPTVTLSPASSTVYQGQTFSVNVELAADSNNHSETTFTVAFPAAVLRLDSISQGSLYFNQVANTIDNVAGTGTATYNFFGGSQSTSGTVATLQFTALATGTGSLAFTGTNQVLDSGSIAFTSPTFTGSTYTVSAPLTESILTLSSDYTDWSQGDSQTVTIALDTQGNEVAGVDIDLTFNPAVLQITNTNWAGLFPNQQGLTFNNSAGTLSVSGVVNQGSPYNGQGTILTITFQALAIGTSNIDFAWTSGLTTDTNIVDYNNANIDMLSSDPAALAITVSSGGTLDFTFGLLDFLGDMTTKTGTLKVSGPNVTTNWSSPTQSGAIPNLLGTITGHPLGTFAYGSAYDVIITVPGYLKTKQNATLSSGTNPTMAFGDLKPGDSNGDGVNNSFDLSSVFGQWNSSFSTNADFNGDGTVNTFDVAILYQYFNLVDTI